MLLISPIGLTGGNALATILPLLGVFAFAGQRMMPELGKMYQSITRIQATRAAIELLHTDLMEARDNPELPKQPPPRVHPPRPPTAGARREPRTDHPRAQLRAHPLARRRATRRTRRR